MVAITFHWLYKISKKILKKKPNPLERWKLKTADWIGFTSYIERKLDTPSPDIKDINSTVETYTSVIIEAANKFIKKKKSLSRHKSVPWWNAECEQAIKESKNAFYNYKKCNTEYNLIEFKRLRAKARYITKKAKKDSWNHYTSTITNSTPPSEIWNKIRRIRGTVGTHNITSLYNNNKFITTNRDIAEALAETYEQNASDSNHHQAFIEHKNQVENQPIPPFTSVNDHLNIPITINELDDVLPHCKNSSPGSDNLPYAFLQHLPRNGKEQLLRIYDKILKAQTFPEKWHEAIIIPVLKPKKPRNNVSSYRPISLTCTMCKILERILNRRLLWFLETNHLLTDTQSGFRKNRSTNDNIINLETEIHEAFANKQQMLAVALDLEKAYDITWKRRIVHILYDWGIRGDILAFIHNFLNNRTFRVRANGALSNKKNLKNGIPQGSVLSATLFLVAINSIVENVSAPVKINLYADDVILYIKGKNNRAMQEILQQTMHKLEDWSLKTGFRFSLQKTKFILFSKKRRFPQLHLKLHGSSLQSTQTIQFLGVKFDRKLTWKEHFDYLKQKCAAGINLMKVLSHHYWGASTDSLLNIYRSIVRSRLDYGSIAFTTARKSYIKTIDRIQHKCLRLALGAFPTTPIESLQCIANEPPLSLRREQLSLIYATTISTTPNNFNYRNTFSTRFKSIFNSKPHIPPPFYHRIGALENKLGIQINTSLPLLTSLVPPWTITNININDQLTLNKKSDTHPLVIKNAFTYITEQQPNTKFIYTDASKTEHGVGSAVVTPETIFKFRLPKESSIFTGELYAIHQALVHIRNHTGSNYTICSDSMSSLASFSQIYPSHPLVSIIKQLLNQLQNLGTTVNFVYTPSHVGIPGNERADHAAKEAVQLPIESVTQIHIHTDYKHHIKKLIKQEWQNQWNRNNISHLYQIKPSTSTSLILPSSRRQQIAITRLRLGHTRLTHSFLMQKEDPPVCNNCNARLSIPHIIQECPTYFLSRQKHNISENLEIAMGNSMTNIHQLLEFLKEIQLVNKI